MRKTFILTILTVLSAVCCTKESDFPAGQEKIRMHVESDGSKVQLNAGLQTVWNSGDKVSVFMDAKTSENQCWNYVGDDMAVSGDIEHQDDKFVWSANKTALYPYDSEATLSSGIIRTSIPTQQFHTPKSFAFTIMAAKTRTNTLRFKYATAFVRVILSGLASIDDIVLRANGGEALAGSVSIDMNSAVPVLTSNTESPQQSITLKTKDSSPMTVSAGENLECWFAIPPMAYSDGFTLTVNKSDGKAKTIRYTGAILLHGGEYVTVEDDIYDEFTIPVSFASTPAFTPAFPTSSDGFKSKDDTIYDTVHTLSYEGKTYDFKFHAGYYEKDGTPSYGYYYNASQSRMVIGRGGSYIKLPSIENYVPARISYVAGSTNGNAHIACTEPGVLPTDGDICSNLIGSTVAGEEYTMYSNVSDPGKDYYFRMKGNGNIVIKEICFTYKKIK